MATIRITAENVNNYPEGTEIEVWYGAMYGRQSGIVTGYEINKWGVQLLAKMDDGSIQTINAFTTVGIGTYLKKVAEKPVRKDSPWYREE